MLTYGKDSNDNVIPLLLDASGNVIVSASQLTTTGGKINIDASGNVIVSASQLTTTGGKISVDANGYIQAITRGLYGGALQRSPIAFGPSGAVSQNVSNAAIPAGTSQQTGAAVPAGRIWVITNLSFVISIAIAAGNITSQVVLGGTLVNLWRQTNPAASALYDRQGYWVMAAGDYLNFQIVGGTAGAIFAGTASGFYMDMNQ